MPVGGLVSLSIHIPYLASADGEYSIVTEDFAKPI